MTELATTSNPTKSKTGSSLRRVEDAHLLVGKGRFTDNRPAVGQLHLHFIRSYLAHGRIVGVDKEEVSLEASFTNDLGADSLDTVELIMEFEKEFNIAIPDDQAENIATVGEAVKYIEEHAS